MKRIESSRKRANRCACALLCLVFTAAALIPHTEAAAETQGAYYGELSGDGKITVTDLSVLNQAVNGRITLTADEKKRADLNGDGSITSADVDLLQQYLLRVITEFPVESQLASISITRLPDRLAYTLWTAVDLRGMVVTAYYNNGTSRVVKDYRIDGDTSASGRRQIQVRYTEAGITKTASFYIQVAEKQEEKKTLAYHANGGSGAPSAQTAAVNTPVKISSVIPVNYYKVVLNANGGSVSLDYVNVKAKFTGWSTSQNGTVNYLPGAELKLADDTTLYARYEGAALGNVPVPVRNGYTFKGWYYGSLQVSAGTKIASNCQLTAKWGKNSSSSGTGNETQNPGQNNSQNNTQQNSTNNNQQNGTNSSQQNGGTNGSQQNGGTNSSQQNGGTNGSQQNGGTNGGQQNGGTNGGQQNGTNSNQQNGTGTTNNQQSSTGADNTGIGSAWQDDTGINTGWQDNAGAEPGDFWYMGAGQDEAGYINTGMDGVDNTIFDDSYSTELDGTGGADMEPGSQDNANETGWQNDENLDDMLSGGADSENPADNENLTGNGNPADNENWADSENPADDDELAADDGYYNVEWNVSSAVLQKGKSTSAVAAYVTGEDEIVQYTSSNKSVATVSAKGKIKAKKVGTAVITAKTKHGCTARVRIKVQKKAVTTKKLTVSQKKVSLKAGKTFDLEAEVSPVTSSQGIQYMSSNPKVAAVSRKGQIKAKKKGTAVIKVKSGKKIVKVKVTVK